jgi:hypothetical protein
MSGRKNYVGENRQRNSDKSRQGRPTDNISRGRKEAKPRQDRQSTYKCNIYARSRNHCCCGKTTSITQFVCVCVCAALIIHHEMRMRCIIYSSVAYLSLQYFSKSSHKRHDFREGG